LRLGADLLDEKDLDEPADPFLGSGGVDTRAASKQACRQHPRVVHDQPVASLQIFRQVAKVAVFPAAGRAVEHQHAAAIAAVEGLLRDQLGRKVKTKIGNPHVSL
jgi:hypothetical protein